jgi:hypothetical protein
MERIREKRKFQKKKIHNIYRELNTKGNEILKQALTLQASIFKSQEKEDIMFFQLLKVQ